jgi:uncharacterized lipoprotein YddW (UPF0748 family)
MIRAAIFIALALEAARPLLAAAVYVPSNLKPPQPQREFRGVWVATVGNIDWPSKKGLTTEQQKLELIWLLDRAAQLRLNAILLQVRPGCDALYASPHEPWSEYLTGVMGQAPKPFYDPLAFAVEEAHRRGLELHAWFNPFRARHTSALSPVSKDHVSKTHPQWVRKYGPLLWLDPGEKLVQDHSLRVILDVVKRYDVDGVHLDDYFYPYPEKDGAGRELAFPDGSSWQRYLERGGKLSLDNWRRENVDRFVQNLYASIKAEKPFVKFGISPFGIWRPGFPPQIKGFDAYDGLYADSRKWLANGWLDYFTPQLYWSIEPKEQSYPALLNWWAGQNVMQRHLWPGDAPARLGPNRPAHEIVEQIRLTQNQPGASGNVHWSMKSLLQNRQGIGEALLKEVYTQTALPPASPWLVPSLPGKPGLSVTNAADGGALQANWTPAGTNRVHSWLLQSRRGGEWSTETLRGDQRSRAWEAGGAPPDVIAVTPLDRCWNAGPSSVMERRASPVTPPSLR